MVVEANWGTTAASATARPAPELPRFQVFIAYDCPANAQRALLLLAGLAAHFREGLEIHHSLCRFDRLFQLTTREAAVRGAVQADLVILAANGEQDLPASVRDWLDAWTEQAGSGSAALVALLEQHPPTAAGCSTVRAFLESLAPDLGVALFAREFNVQPDAFTAEAEPLSPPRTRPSVTRNPPAA